MVLALLATVALMAAFSASDGPADFDDPVDVVIEGYDDHAMEPFISRDGAWLFFNNRNQPQDQTDLHLAERVTATRFRYVGPLSGANSEDLDGVPSMDEDGGFFFVSPRNYDGSKNTLWQGEFRNGEVSNVAEIEGDAPRRKALWIYIDAEVSADGERLYFVESRWRLFRGGIKSANLLVAARDEDGAYRRPPNAEAMFAAINTDLLEFAPALTRDEKTLYFTRVDRAALRDGVEDGFGIYVATRSSPTEPFGTPERIGAITGYVEAPTVSPGECAIYFHKRVDGLFRIQMAKKTGCRDNDSEEIAE